MPNPFVHMEFMTGDVPRAKQFFAAMFDWKLDDTTGAGGTPYTMFRTGDSSGGGIMQNPVPGSGALWVPYVLVDDVVAATRKAESLGAKVMKEVTELQGMGSFSIINDPTGAMLGLWQNKQA